MGCISKILIIPECWRSLSYQGVHYLYAPEGSSLRKFIGTTKALQQAQPLAAKPVIPAKFVESAQLSTSSPGSPHAPKYSPPKPATNEQKINKIIVQNPPSAQEKLGFAEPDWPAIWLSFVEKVKAGRALLWTYPEAGQDLSGKGDKQRSDLVRKIITTLNLPAGSSNFWPHRSEPQVSKAEENLYFLKGIDVLNPKFVLVFGPEALADINPEAKFVKHTYINFKGRLLLILPSMDELYTPSDLDVCLSFLSTFTNSLKKVR